MYKIIESYNHKYTFFFLHSMHYDDSEFNTFIEYFKNNKHYSYIFKYIKFIFPNSPIMDIDYPNNKLFDQKSWYNYYTCYDGINKIDKINVDDYNNQTNIIVDLINKEAKILGNYSRIYIGGSSQGGTMIFNILKELSKNIGGLFCLRSIYMYKYTKLNKKLNKTPIFVYSGKLDNIYTLTLQKKCFNILKKKGYKIDWTIIDNLNHHDVIEEQFIFLINSFIKTII